MVAASRAERSKKLRGYFEPTDEERELNLKTPTIAHRAIAQLVLRGYLKVIVTPNFHHWHHSQDDEAIDKNYAAHFAFIDYLFGTAVMADEKWPKMYGVVGDYVPNGFWKQVKFPFTWKG